MKKVLCILENGFEEIEAIAPIDLLRRAGVEVTLASFSDLSVTGKHGICIQADALWQDCSYLSYDALFLPGGPAVILLRRNIELLDLIRSFYSEGKLIAAICAAPLLLHDAGVLSGKIFTSHFSTWKELPTSTKERVVVDGQLCTARGAGTSIEFGLKFLSLLSDENTASEIAQAIMV